MSLRTGQLEHFCTCLLRNNKEHLTAANKEGDCVYCGHSILIRKVTEADKRTEIKYGEELRKLKMEALEIRVKDIRYDNKVN